MSSTINYLIFFNFYLENKDKLFMESGKKSINYENVEKWFQNIQNYSPEEIKPTYDFFAHTFIEFLLYVPFAKLYEILNRISFQLVEIVNSGDYKNIYFYIADSANKSNLWVALLFLDCLIKNNISLEIQKIKFVNNYDALVNDSNNERSLCLYCDDMSYTGSQIKSNFLNLCTFKTPTKWAGMSDKGNSYHALEMCEGVRGKNANLEDTNIDKYLIIAYLSNTAYTKLSTIKNVHFFKDTVVVNSYIDQLKNKYGETNPEMVENVVKMFTYNPTNLFFTMGRKACNCNMAYTPIYFDHKIADELSTFNKLLFTGSYPTTSVCEINPLIHGCNDIVMLESFFGKNPCTTNYTLDSEVPCFPSFYKTILYTINGNKINEDENIVALLVEAQAQIKGGKSKKRRSTLGSKKKNKNKKKRNSRNTRKKRKNQHNTKQKILSKR